MKDKINGITNNFFDNIYQFEPNKLLSSLNNKSLTIKLFLKDY